MADFKTPDLAGASATFNAVLNKFDSIKAEVAAALEEEASVIAATLNTSVVEELTAVVRDLVPEIPALPNVNLQSEMTALLAISQDTVAGRLEFAAKQADLKSKFGDGLTAGGFDLDTLTTNAAAAQKAALTATTDISSATSALATAKATATSSLDTAFEASLKLDRSNIPNPTGLINNLSESSTSAISALSSQASATTALATVKGASTRIQDVVPNYELPAAGGVAFEKAPAVLQPEVDTVEEKVSTLLKNPKLSALVEEVASEQEEYERETPKVLPTEDEGAYAVSTSTREVTKTVVSEEEANSAQYDEPKIKKEDSATITTTVTTSEESVKEVSVTGGGSTVLRSNVAPAGFSRRPQTTYEKVGTVKTKEIPGTIKKETINWTDQSDNSGSIEVDVITLANKPIEVVRVSGKLDNANRRFRTIEAAGSKNIHGRDHYSIDKNGRILIGFVDSEGKAPLPSGKLRYGIWERRHKYGLSGTKPDKTTGKIPEKRKHIYKVTYKYNDNYDPSFNGNAEKVKEKGNPKSSGKFTRFEAEYADDGLKILKLENYRGRRMAHVQLGPDYGNQEAVMLGLSDSSAVFNAITKAKRLFREKSS